MSHHSVDSSSRKWNASDTCPKYWFQKIRRNKTKWKDAIQKYNLWDPNIVDLSGDPFRLSLILLLLQGKPQPWVLPILWRGRQRGQQNFSPRNYIFDVSDKITNLLPKQFIFTSPTKLKTWLTDIQADAKSIQAIHKTRNISEDAKTDHFFNETYTGRFKDPRTDRFSPSRANQPICGFMTHESWASSTIFYKQYF